MDSSISVENILLLDRHCIESIDGFELYQHLNIQSSIHERGICFHLLMFFISFGSVL